MVIAPMLHEQLSDGNGASVLDLQRLGHHRLHAGAVDPGIFGGQLVLALEALGQLLLFPGVELFLSGCSFDPVVVSEHSCPMAGALASASQTPRALSTMLPR